MSRTIFLLGLQTKGKNRRCKSIDVSRGVDTQPLDQWLIVVVYFPWFKFWEIRREKEVYLKMTTTTTNISPYPTTIQGVLGSSCMVEISFDSVLLVVNMWPEKDFKAKTWERICTKPLLLDKLSTRIYKSLSPFHRLTIEVKFTFQVVVCAKTRTKTGCNCMWTWTTRIVVFKTC